VHVHGTPPQALIEACRELGLPLHAFPWTERAAARGYARDALYLVRPDGYVGLAAADAQALAQYVEAWRLRAQ